MSSQQKLPLVKTLSVFGQRKALDEIEKRGHALPGHVVSVNGPFVTVNFDLEDVTLPQLTLPLPWPEYVRLPIQENDRGYAFPTMAYLGGVTGQGGKARLASLQGNLSTLTWFPIANKSWGTVDPNAVVLYGPNGVVLKDSAGHTTATLTPSGLVVTAQTSITFQVGSKSIVINSSGVTIEGKQWLAHEHSGVQTGGGNTGGVV